jgi:hypothetical protein
MSVAINGWIAIELFKKHCGHLRTAGDRALLTTAHAVRRNLTYLKKVTDN